MSLKDQLIARIKAHGPMSVAEYMGDCLLHPTLGYYTTQHPFGGSGDFITAPETSQMFGELIGLCLVQAWVDQGRPSPFALVELGPGRGVLMADILRAAAQVPDFARAAEVILVEASPKLQEIQRDTLKAHAVTFVKDVASLPQCPLFVVANEFFDALPIRQFVRSGPHWRERQVGCDAEQLIFGMGAQTPQPALNARLSDTKEHDLVEYAPAAAPIMSELGSRIDTHGGAGLIIDYGDWRSLGDTLQAVRQHEYTGVLDHPGESDLTAHVDFEALAQAVPCAFSRLTPQGVFLERLGITQRAQRLAQNLPKDLLEQHIKAHRRLTHPEEMGNLFKVLGLFPHGKAPPAGLEI
ncbi:methyltransferase [Roseobacter denitrificans]|uniref:Hypothetical membrane protein n=1 Tax=Roseobacter denitrificans (strain ATCC 33942 / OCh 114) TaxID=375451 RepID=Q162V8_ROSDO|nr:SAM-dependent methyltransferase [Roseobacter denitrificans]ABG32985.1 hypothetical membrane protein [Roseobacter denitrificans OCh 114]AVL54826.1 methyltransferase [Roseobacter denitrificans]